TGAGVLNDRDLDGGDDPACRPYLVIQEVVGAATLPIGIDDARHVPHVDDAVEAPTPGPSPKNRGGERRRHIAASHAPAAHAAVANACAAHACGRGSGGRARGPAVNAHDWVVQ